MKLLVTGSDGLVGRNILPILAREFEIIPSLESEWDITDRKRGEEIIGHVEPEALLNLAAFTDVDGCEDRQELAFRVNAEGAATLADICSTKKIGIIYFSSDYVFDGKKQTPYTEEDETNPLSVYGKSKRLGEEKVMQANPLALVIRTEWIYGDGGGSFITKVVRAARERGSVDVVNDQRGSPTYARDLAKPLAALIRAGRTGIYHITNSGSCTWYELARHVFSVLDLHADCRPITSDRSNRKAKRPAYSVLDCSKMQTDTNMRMRSWQEAVEEYLKSNESNILLGRTPSQ